MHLRITFSSQPPISIPGLHNILDLVNPMQHVKEYKMPSGILSKNDVQKGTGAFTFYIHQKPFHGSSDSSGDLHSCDNIDCSVLSNCNCCDKKYSTPIIYKINRTSLAKEVEHNTETRCYFLDEIGAYIYHLATFSWSGRKRKHSNNYPPPWTYFSLPVFIVLCSVFLASTTNATTPTSTTSSTTPISKSFLMLLPPPGRSTNKQISLPSLLKVYGYDGAERRQVQNEASPKARRQPRGKS